MAEPEIPPAHLEPRTLGERVTQLRGVAADAKRRKVAEYSQPVGAGMWVVAAIVIVGGCVLGTLHELHYF